MHAEATSKWSLHGTSHLDREITPSIFDTPSVPPARPCSNPPDLLHPKPPDIFLLPVIPGPLPRERHCGIPPRPPTSSSIAVLSRCPTRDALLISRLSRSSELTPMGSSIPLPRALALVGKRVPAIRVGAQLKVPIAVVIVIVDVFITIAAILRRGAKQGAVETPRHFLDQREQLSEVLAENIVAKFAADRLPRLSVHRPTGG